MTPRAFLKHPDTHEPLIVQIQHRADFLAVQAKHRKHVTPGFIVQIHHRSTAGPVRLGFTATRKIGGAVERNRAKRRLRGLVRDLRETFISRPNTDIVLIARPAVLSRAYTDLKTDLAACLS